MDYVLFLNSRMVIQTISLVIFLTIILSFVKNRSNFSSYLIVPVIVSLVTKYVMGDWDVGFVWSQLDILYWSSLLGTSLLTLKLLEIVRKD